MRRTKREQGITLIALIITIIVLLILAVVAIGALQNDGIINHAKNARDEYGKAQNTENTTLEGYLSKIEANLPENNGGGSSTLVPTTTVLEAQGKVLSTDSNTVAADEYGNIIVVPAGFKITADASKVTEGIVIEDCTETATKGSQFVWIPTPKDGKVYTNKEKTEYKTIILGRYSNFTANNSGEHTPAQTAANYATATEIEDYYTEDTAANHDEDYKNAIAKDIGAFITSATIKGGYYLGRYEAGVINYDSSKTITSNSNNETNWTGYVAESGKELKLVSKRDIQVWNYVTQPKASELSRNMYKDATTYTSDLVNSYAWDTAIVFIQTFSTETDASNYANLNKSSTSIAKTGINADQYCNINDMSGNAYEWSTETASYALSPYVIRGGYYYTYGGYPVGHTSNRNVGIPTGDRSISFRPLLYL